MSKSLAVLLVLFASATDSMAEITYRILSPTPYSNSISLTNNGQYSNLCRVEWLNANRRASDVTISQGGSSTIYIRANSTELINTDQVIDRNLRVSCSVDQDEVKRERDRQIFESQQRQRAAELQRERGVPNNSGKNVAQQNSQSNEQKSTELDLGATRRANEEQQRNLQLMDEKIAAVKRENEINQELLRRHEIQRRIDRENAERAERLAQTTSMLNSLGDADLQNARNAIDLTRLPQKCQNYVGSYNMDPSLRNVDQNADAENLFNTSISSNRTYDPACALHKAIEAYANKQLAQEEFNALLRKILIPVPTLR